MSEVYFCGKCNHQQRPKDGEACIYCKKTTVSWYTNRETVQDAKRKWKYVNR